jgi:hypothetical protein
MSVVPVTESEVSDSEVSLLFVKVKYVSLVVKALAILTSVLMELSNAPFHIVLFHHFLWLHKF